MAFINDQQEITIYRGDCFSVPIFVNMGTDKEPIRLDFNQFQDLNIELYFGVYIIGGVFENSFIAKKFTHLNANNYGDIIINLQPQDTLYVCPGKYQYAVKLRMQDPIQGDWIHTIIDRKNFYII